MFLKDQERAKSWGITRPGTRCSWGEAQARGFWRRQAQKTGVTRTTQAGGFTSEKGTRDADAELFPGLGSSQADRNALDQDRSLELEAGGVVS